MMIISFGVLHSRWHEVWARAQGTQVRERESWLSLHTDKLVSKPFRFQNPIDTKIEAIAAAAKELNELRETWLNPLEWTLTRVFCNSRATSDGPWSRFVQRAGCTRYRYNPLPKAGSA